MHGTAGEGGHAPVGSRGGVGSSYAQKLLKDHESGVGPARVSDRVSASARNSGGNANAVQMHIPFGETEVPWDSDRNGPIMHIGKIPTAEDKGVSPIGSAKDKDSPTASASGRAAGAGGSKVSTAEEKL